MQIRVANLDDVGWIVQLLGILFPLEAEFTPDSAAQERGTRLILQNPTAGTVLVLEDAAAIIGMVTLLYTISTALGERVAWLEDMIVAPDHRRRGAGTFLLRAAIEHARAAGCHRITLLTDGANHEAQAFYHRQGFVQSKMVPMRLQLDVPTNYAHR